MHTQRASLCVSPSNISLHSFLTLASLITKCDQNLKELTEVIMKSDIIYINITVCHNPKPPSLKCRKVAEHMIFAFAKMYTVKQGIYRLLVIRCMKYAYCKISNLTIRALNDIKNMYKQFLMRS